MARRRKSSIDLSLDPETRRGIAVVFLFALAILLLLGLFDLAGAFGKALDDGMAHVFGWDRLLVPFFLLAWGYHLLSPERLLLRLTNTLGIILFFLSANPLIHALFFPTGGRLSDLALRSAGGKLGETVALPLMDMVGLAGTVTLSIALMVISLLLIFNTTLRQVLFFVHWIMAGLRWLGRMIALPIKAMREKRIKAEEEAKLNGFMQARPGEKSQDTVHPEEVEEDVPEEEEEEEEAAEEPEGEVAAIKSTIAPKVRARKRIPRVEIPLEKLDRRDQKPSAGDIDHNKDVIAQTLKTFGIPVEMHEVSVGPTVTQFALKPSDGVKLSRITGLHNDLALALAAHPIRIEAPIPGKSLVGIEVPNQSVATVGLREILESREFRERKTSTTFVLGKDVAGKPWTADLARMPHMLVAGATGSGKSVMLNVLIMSFLYTNGPDDLKIIMVDPKRVELQVYNGIPHLLTPVITKVPETVNALKWGLREMDRRYDLLAKFGARDLATYNTRVQEKLPVIVYVIDELADLMATSAQEVEGPIVRLAQMSRAVGIHLVLATQRPSVDVITGLIKANVPARIAFAVASATDSRTILDQTGADKLLGRGDMLFSTAELATPKRVQGAFVSDVEIARVVDFIKLHSDPVDYDLTVVERPAGAETMFNQGGGEGMDADDSDPMIPHALEEIKRAGKASASLLQRRLKVGYARAARLLDLLEQQGYIGPSDGAKPREILKLDFGKQSPPPTPLAEAEEPEESEDEDSDAVEEEI